MVRVYLLRHAKSDWDTGLPDHDRPLNDRGRRAAARMGRYMAAKGFTPDLVLCSTATRARETLARAMEAGELDFPVQYEPALYGAGSAGIIGTIRQDAGHLQSVLLVGHNPGFHDAALSLVGDGPVADRKRLYFKYPTGTLCAIDFAEPTLADIEPGMGKLIAFIAPKDIA